MVISPIDGWGIKRLGFPSLPSEGRKRWLRVSAFCLDTYATYLGLLRLSLISQVLIYPWLLFYLGPIPSYPGPKDRKPIRGKELGRRTDARPFQDGRWCYSLG